MPRAANRSTASPRRSALRSGAEHVVSLGETRRSVGEVVASSVH